MVDDGDCQGPLDPILTDDVRVKVGYQLAGVGNSPSRACFCSMFGEDRVAGRDALTANVRRHVPNPGRNQSISLDHGAPTSVVARPQKSQKVGGVSFVIPVLCLLPVLGPARHSLASWFPSSEAARPVMKSPPVAEEFLAVCLPRINRRASKSQTSSRGKGRNAAVPFLAYKRKPELRSPRLHLNTSGTGHRLSP